MNKIQKIVYSFMILFGILTVFSGGKHLLLWNELQSEGKNFHLWILTFNFIAGFFYILVGIGLLREKHWSRILVYGIASATAVFYAVFIILVLNGSPYEKQTLYAMGFRTIFWIGAAVMVRWRGIPA